MNHRLVVLSAVALAFLATGCATKIRVTSDPAGAIVRYRGEGRAAFRWKTAPTVTPCEMDVYYGRLTAYAIWPDSAQTNITHGLVSGVKSEKQTVNLRATRDEETIHFKKP